MFVFTSTRQPQVVAEILADLWLGTTAELVQVNSPEGHLKWFLVSSNDRWLVSLGNGNFQVDGKNIRSKENRRKWGQFRYALTQDPRLKM